MDTALSRTLGVDENNRFKYDKARKKGNLQHVDVYFALPSEAGRGLNKNAPDAFGLHGSGAILLDAAENI